jgi:dipeptidyl aminopeptidase/acylaminoacyl peptidase
MPRWWRGASIRRLAGSSERLGSSPRAFSISPRPAVRPSPARIPEPWRVPRRLAWIARDGRHLGSVAPDAPWVFSPRLSPDGSRLAVSRQVPATGSTDLWVYDMPAGTPTQLAADVFVDNWVNWFPDGRTVILSRSGPDYEPRLMTKSVVDVHRPVHSQTCRASTTTPPSRRMARRSSTWSRATCSSGVGRQPSDRRARVVVTLPPPRETATMPVIWTLPSRVLRLPPLSPRRPRPRSSPPAGGSAIACSRAPFC